MTMTDKICRNLLTSEGDVTSPLLYVKLYNPTIIFRSDDENTCMHTTIHTPELLRNYKSLLSKKAILEENGVHIRLTSWINHRSVKPRCYPFQETILARTIRKNN